MSKIYILQGSTGEYSDRTDWIVQAYKDKVMADEECKQANQEANDYKEALDKLDNTKNDYYDKIETYEKELSKKYLSVDPTAKFDYTGTSYWVVKCDLYE